MAAPNLASASTITGKTTAAALTTTLTTTLLSNAAASGKVYKVNMILVSNVDGTNAVDVTVDYYNGTTGYKIANTVSVPADSSVYILGKDNGYLYLEENTSIRGGAAVASDAEIIISYEELS